MRGQEGRLQGGTNRGAAFSFSFFGEAASSKFGVDGWICLRPGNGEKITRIFFDDITSF